MGIIFVIALRLLLPITIFRWPLLGGILCLIADALDIVILDIIDTGGFSDYHSTDKYMDVVYLSVEAFVSLRWKNQLAKKVNIYLFVYRWIGFILFEITKIRVFLLIFPNLFENFYLFYLSYKKIAKRDRLTSIRPMVLVLLLLLIPKLGQEFLLHFLEAKPWGWIIENILHPLNIPI